jgi:hypothetical protein
LRSHPRWSLTLLLLAALVLGGCSEGDVCDECQDDNDCGDDLYCSEFEDGSWRCADSIWTECSTKSHVTAP